MKTQVQFYQAGSEVSRYHTVKTLMTETVGHHSHGVAMLCIILEPNARAELIKSALFHDLSEHQTGDIPSPAKREYGIGEQVSELEDRLLSEAGLEMPVLDKDEKRVLKLADIAQGALFCVKEIGLGNKSMSVVYHRYKSYAEAFVLKGKERQLFDIIDSLYKENVK